ncbi:MAG: S8 family serine peptidase [bacterium]
MLHKLVFLLLVSLIVNLVFVPGVSSSEFVPGELILKLKRSPKINQLDLPKKGQGIFTNLPTLDELNREFHVTEMKKLLELHPPIRESSIQAIDLTDLFKLILPADSDLEAVAAAYRKNPLVEYAEPNYIRRVSYTPNDPSLSWGLSKVEAYSAWDITSGSNEAIIAVVDTGLDWDHPDLAANVWINAGEIPGNGLDDEGNGFVDDYMGWDFTDAPGGPGAEGEDYLERDNDPMDFHGHGTHVAGIVAAVANNYQGSAGLAYGCKVMAVRSGYATNNGDGWLEDDDCAAAIIYAADNGAKVINMSWGSYSPSSVIQDALDYAALAGCLLIGAAGNSNTSSVLYPAGYPNVLAVAATDNNDRKASFSNYGHWIDVCAPGTGIYSTLFDNTYASWSGTSMAAPFVAALGGLIFSQNPTWNWEKVAQHIKETADNIDSINPSYAGLLGSGRINAYRAVLSETEPLACTLTTPPADIWLRGTVTISAEAGGGSGIRWVEFGYSTNSTDGQDGDWFDCPGSPDSSAPYYIEWATQPAAGTDSAVWLRARAKDNSEAYSGYDTRMIKVDNSGPTFVSWTANPSDLTGSSSGSFTLQVEIVDDGSGLTGSTPQFDYRIDPGGYDKYEDMTFEGANSWSYQIPEPAGGWASQIEKTIYYHARCSDALGNEGISSEQAEFIEDDVAPPGVSNFSALAMNGRIDLQWDNPTVPDWQGTQIRVAADTYPASPAEGTLVYDGTATSFTHTGLTNGTTYYYSAFTYDEVPNYSWPAYAEATPLASPLSIVLPAETLPAGSTFWADVVLGEDNNAAEDLMGLSFVLTYSETSTLRVTEDHIFVETGSFLGPGLVEMSKADQEKGEIRLGLSRKYPAEGATGFGRIARLEFQLLPGAMSGQVISFNLKDVTARNEADDPIDLSVYPDKLTVSHIIVWAGDTNNDGLVNEIDILPIASYWGLTGPVREGASSSWEGQSASTWSQPEATYADANGDGVIDERELIPIGLNWDLTHSASGSLAAPVAAMESTRPHPLAAYEAIYRFLQNSPESEATTRMIALLSDLIAEAKTITQIPDITGLEQNYPNPVNPETFIPFHLSHRAQVTIRIYDLSGQLIQTLDLGILEPGSYLNRNRAAFWDGQDEAGNEVASGVYLYQLQTGPHISTRKLIVFNR